MIINQWVPAAHKGDAIGDSARRLRSLLRKQKHESDIYAITIDEELQNDVRPFTDPHSRKADATILHFAVPSPMSQAFTTLSHYRILQYHNITPPHFFAQYHPEICRITKMGREELSTLVGQVDLALGDSEYNRNELRTLGFEQTDIMPIFVGLDRFNNYQSLPPLEQILDDGKANILYVGRIVPNKCLEDHIRLAEHYKRYVDTDYRFLFVGRTDAVPSYYAALRNLILRYDMPPDRFIFTGEVSEVELLTYYQNAHAYLSLSEHEGFCVPLIEAMANDVPVVAYGTTAIPETLGGAGLCFTPKDLEHAAELLGMVIYDNVLRSKVIQRQRQRLAAFGEAAAAKQIEHLLKYIN
tara:strand:- start:60 stop:1124 length:1065 start_codon:yes stop_codon:yes gene_type:complete